jgi:hypothetical protein
MSKEAMKLALEALEAGEYYIDDLEAIVYAADDLGTHEDRAKMQAAIVALREALANEALDKKAENARELGLDYEPARDSGIVTAGGADPRTQRTWVGLTDKEIGVLWFEANDQDNSMIKHFARAIEAKLKEKNT